MDFSHLEDTKFPNLETASPYALKNTFDYTRWVPGTKIKLCNVLWNADYDNVVKFSDDDARDKWFDSIEGNEIELTSNARIIPDGTIKLPLPYDVLTQYNYIRIEIPLATGKDRLIQDETADGVRKWHFFLVDIEYSAPNTSIARLQLDVWTQFIDTVSIKYMMLERGHAPVSVTDTDTYLSNPIENNRYLLAPDVNYDDSSVVRDSKYVPFGSGDKYVCIATTATYSQIDTDFGTAISGAGSFTNPTFSNTSDWYGYQLQVNGFNFDSDYDYTTLSTPTMPQLGNDEMIPTGLSVISIPATDTSFLADVRKWVPAFLRTIKGIFVVDESMITLGAYHTIASHHVYECSGTSGILDGYDLSKEMFGFGSDEQRFAKLYTYPYSRLEVSDNSGKTVEVRIENTGKIGMRMLTSVAFPVLDFRVYLTGINGEGSQSYTWKNLDGEALSLEVPNGDWDKLKFEFDIPTFALYMDAETSWLLDNYSSMMTNGREKALRDYHNSVRSANSSYTTSVNMAATTQTNTNASATTAQANTTRSAQTDLDNASDTGKTDYYNTRNLAHKEMLNTQASAETANTNARQEARAVRRNSKFMATTIKNNSYELADAQYDNAISQISAATANGLEAIAAANTILSTKNTNSLNEQTQVHAMNIATTETNNQTSIAAATNTAAATVSTGIVGGATGGAMSGAAAGPAGAITGGLAGGIAGGYTAVVNAETAVNNARLVAQAASDVVSTVNEKEGYILNHYTIPTSQSVTSRLNSAQLNIDASASSEANITAQTGQIGNSNIALLAQAKRNQSATETNADNTETRQHDNADRTSYVILGGSDGYSSDPLDFGVGSADRTKSTIDSNSNTMYTTRHNNALRTYHTIIGGDTPHPTDEPESMYGTAKRTKETVDTNASATYTVQTENAARLYTTSADNASKTREVAVLNAQETLTTCQDTVKAAYHDASRGAPVQLTTASGDAENMRFGQNGVQFRLRTQSDSAIAQTAAQFARYGYALNQLWDVGTTGLTLMRNFTYWKAKDIWVDVRSAADSGIGDAISGMFKRGITVWSEPDTIGKVGIYDN